MANYSLAEFLIWRAEHCRRLREARTPREYDRLTRRYERERSRAERNFGAGEVCAAINALLEAECRRPREVAEGTRFGAGDDA